mmetsp:Transcript_3078/g.4273  ORF Transcript_3078/g.4273 Transcript_3078/m.4273 type:complete len:429 (+) Transcript_3078:47-1333(+)|eukprot:CAMPEP_0170077444 /NCGR_PEP_ID=MMETSP0019_2-20121128/14259_1 /TAXON_ID=98059 /ORGANISM="Dinobryon sp., Strain UTEXLB2267" /LENGTH=428 /DNA_ID=CAMNT_0010289775 /DNA_START=42 /DNA_END=1328 /DNA_ORIENTATION=-
MNEEIDVDVFNENDDDDGAELLSFGDLNVDELIASQQLIPTQLDPPIIFDIGQQHPDWIFFLSSLSKSSRPQYEKVIMDFVTWVSANNPNGLALEQLFRDYFVQIYEFNNRPGAPSFAATRYRSMASIFVSFWTYTGRGDLKQLAPAVWVFISGWERGYEEKHATAFTKEELLQFHQTAPTNPCNLFLKCYSSLMCSFAGRSSELVNMEWKDITRLTEEGTGLVFFKLMYIRLKQRAGKPIKTDKASFIRGELEVKAIEDWISCFNIAERKGRFFRKLFQNKVRGIYAGKLAIGKNTCASVGKQIASFLNLPNPSNYTGQCWRGTAATLLADEGLTTKEIQRVTGHKSEKSLQVYVDNSKVAKNKVASALAIGNIEESQYVSSPPSAKRPCHENFRNASAGQENVHYNINITVGENSTCTGLSFFGMK